MDTTHYNLTLTIFFISYALFEPLANILLKRFRPSVFLPAIMYVAQVLIDATGDSAAALAQHKDGR